ncbi:Na+/phosphate symporter [Nitzschia inconspicua]|uniref:Na+/phosphate symporter n=1 Tax=Nitzschia inconspicua TaxID=303405 RepID=A0A9K3LDL6_9STRA|nr:Na+/phosphate symporter [Nitzschia inconspicua]KAG7359523.1 Na+/phosphate symporter [Nitzschia inconspicua]
MSMDINDTCGANGKDFAVIDETSGSLVMVPLSDEEDEKAITDRDDAGGGSHAESIQTQSNHQKSKSRIGTVYRSTREKGIHVAVQSGHDSSPNSATLGDVDEESVTWADVATAACCHTASGWAYIALVLVLILLLLYFFMVGLDLLSSSFQVVSGCTAGSLLGGDTNPLASLLIGIVATALLQSSSTTTSIVVSMCGAGLDVQAGIYIVMGANVGTSVTSIIVSLSHMGQSEEFEAAFAGSSLYYLFNIYTAIVLFPLEVGTQYLFRLTKAMLPAEVGSGDSWNSPIKAIVNPLTRTIIIANKNLVTDISTGVAENCEEYYPVICEGGIESYATCKAGLIACDKATNKCPAFFQDGASKTDDLVSGYVCLVFAVVILSMCLVLLVSLLRIVLLGASRRIVYKATKMNGLLAVLIGIGVTILVQSSSATTSALIPLAGIGVLKLEDMYPLCVGADIGTTFTALMAALVSSSLDSLQIAFAHLFFNVTGAVMFYIIPFMRRFVISSARKLGVITRYWRGFPAFFIVFVFFLVPLLLLGMSSCFEKKSKGFTALGIFVVVVLFCCVVGFWCWWRFRSGKDKCLQFLSNRRRKKAAMMSIADDMDFMRVDIEYCKKEIAHIKDFSNMPFIMRMEERDGNAEYGDGHRRIDEAKAAALVDLDEAVSLYESCASAPWTQVLVGAADSVKEGFVLTRTPSRARSPSPTRHSRRLTSTSASGRRSSRKLDNVGSQN